MERDCDPRSRGCDGLQQGHGLVWLGTKLAAEIIGGAVMGQFEADGVQHAAIATGNRFDFFQFRKFVQRK